MYISMTMKKIAKLRLFVDQPLGEGNSISLDAGQAHYLFGVMRRSAGEQIALFNGKDGEWRAEVIQAGKKKGIALCSEQLRPQRDPPDLWLLFAPVKKARTDFIVEKATEMGVRRICPVQSDFTNSDRIRQDKQQAHAVEAAEQCGATFVPAMEPIAKLSKLLDDWPADRKLMFCDETRLGAASSLAQQAPGKWAILVGPEGGFSQTERSKLAAMPQAVPVSLGPRILRAETAVVAGLALWQSALGDWAEERLAAEDACEVDIAVGESR
jgi:16S rRNA (uracil1498-N3)-methyltransferase